MLWNILNYVYIGAVVLLLFNLTIFIHELGHFLVGRWRGATIERFAIWFGPAIWKKNINGVEWRLGCIPLGGYVAFPQLAMEAIEGKSETPAEKMKPLKPIKDKVPILFAGSFMNVVLGFAVATLVWIVGEPKEGWYNDMKIGYVSPKSPEWEAGIRPGDIIKSINGAAVSNWDDIRADVAFSTKSTVEVGLEREGQPLTLGVVPAHNEMFHIRELSVDHKEDVIAAGVKKGSPGEKAGLVAGDKFLEIDGERIFSQKQLVDLIGDRSGKQTHIVVVRDGKNVDLDAVPEMDPKAKVGKLQVSLDYEHSDKLITIYPSPTSQIKKSLLMMYDTLIAIINRKTTGVGVSDLAGPVGIAHQLVKQIQFDIRLAFSFLVVLNINLAVVNLLPIPVLDGGHIVFSIIEAIRKRPLNQKLLESTQMVFVALLLTFMLYVTFNDVGRIFRWEILPMKEKAAKEATNSPPAESSSPSSQPTK
jgi:regulator of sigma E protease